MCGVKYFLKRIVEGNEKLVFTDNNGGLYQYFPSRYVKPGLNLYTIDNLQKCTLEQKQLFKFCRHWFDIYCLETGELIEIPEKYGLKFSIDGDLRLIEFKDSYPNLYNNYVNAFCEWQHKTIDTTKDTYYSSFRNDIYTGHTTLKVKLDVPVYVSWNNHTIKGWVKLNENGKYITVILPWSISYAGRGINYMKSGSKDEIWGETGIFEGIIKRKFEESLGWS